MKNQLVIIGLVAVLFCVGFSGCDQINNVLKSEKDRFIGTWVSGNWPQNDTTIPQSHTYFSNGSCSVGNVSGTYETKDGKLVETFVNGQIIFTWEYSFSNNDSVLTLTQVGTTFTLVLYKQWRLKPLQCFCFQRHVFIGEPCYKKW